MATGEEKGDAPAPSAGEPAPVDQAARAQDPAATLATLRADIARALAQLLNKHDLVTNDDGEWPVKSGSAIVIVRVVEGLPPALQLYSPVLRGVATTAELLEALNGINARIRYGRVFVANHVVIAAMELPAVDLTSVHLAFALAELGNLADHLDDTLRGTLRRRGRLRLEPAARQLSRPMIDLAGRVVIVTGGASVAGVGIGSGVGSGICRGFAAAGARVVVHYRSAAVEAEALVAQLRGGGAEAISSGGDLADEPVAAELVATTVRAFGRVDVLVNNAAVQPVQELASMTLADWRAVVDANLAAVFAPTQAAAREMAGRDGGSIIHIASIEGSHPAFSHAHYDASKAAVIMHARAAAIEYGPQGIRVNTVSPGLIERPGIEQDWPEGVARWRGAAPLGRMGTPADVANACVFLASPMAAWITGHDLVVDGGMRSHPLW